MYVSGYPYRFYQLGGRGGSVTSSSRLAKTRPDLATLRKNVSVYMLVVVLADSENLC